VLSEIQQKTVWEGWLGAEIRANYFAEMCGRYQFRHKALTWTTLVFSSGAAATLISDWLPQDMRWVRPTLALLAAGVSFLTLLQQYLRRIPECADLHSRWNRLGNEYKALWDEMYSPDALVRLRELEEKEVELSKSSATAVSNNKRAMLKWQRYVQKQHGFPSVA
jgi:hypothetical protein